MTNAIPERVTNLSRVLFQTEKVAQYDKAAKKILANKIVLAHILKGCVQEYENCDIQEIIENYIDGEPEVGTVGITKDETNICKPLDSQLESVSVEDGSQTEGTVYYDIRFKALVPHIDLHKDIHLIINVESQDTYNPGYPLEKRGIYYGSRMISSQYGSVFEHAEYDKIQKVYSIWICTDAPVDVRNTITQYQMQANTIIGHHVAPKADYDLISVIMICLDKEILNTRSELLSFLNVVFSNKLTVSEKRKIMEDEYQIPMTEPVESEVDTMGSVGMGILREGYEMGLEQGEEKGFSRGFEVVNLLNERLLMDGRFDDMKRAMKDIGFQKQLMQEYHIL